MIIKYYDNNYKDKFSCKKVCTRCKSVIWTKLFYDVGNFEMTEPSEIPEIGDIVVHGNHCGIVCRIFESNQSVKVYGYDLKGLLNFRYITTYSTKEALVEKIIKDIAIETLQTGKRKIKGLEIENANENITDKVSEAYTVEKIKAADAIKNLSSTYEIGWDIAFQEDKLLFSTQKGTDLSEQIVFSKKFRNIESVEYNISICDSANVGYSFYAINIKKLCRELNSLIDSKGEIIEPDNTNRAESIIEELYKKFNITISLNSNTRNVLDEIINSTNEVKYIGAEPEGMNRRECGLLEDNNNFEEGLKAKKQEETITGTANEKMIYGKDYNIGDYVTVMHNNILTVKQITKVEFAYEPCGSKIVPTFGEVKENILKKIARKV